MLTYKLLNGNIKVDGLITAAACKSLRVNTHHILVCVSFKSIVHKMLRKCSVHVLIMVLVNEMVVMTLMMVMKNLYMNMLRGRERLPKY